MVSSTQKKAPRFPVVVIMGHIDHGKSSLLDYIRKTNVTAGEAGGITQHISAYEAEHTTSDGCTSRITFLDTPGHEAFSAVRNRGASVADVAVLIISAEDGVQPQTIEALNSIKSANVPYVVAINKIDKPNANPDRVKQGLAEHGIYIEEWGGDIPLVKVSAKTGEGIDDLLDMIILVADVHELTGDPEAKAEGIVIESNRDPKKGLSATLIIKNGTLETGSFVVAEDTFSPVRIMEDFAGKPLKKASFSSPIKIIGWNSLPPAGALFTTLSTKREAEEFTSMWHDKKQSEKTAPKKSETTDEDEEKQIVNISLIIEADTAGSLDAVLYEINKITPPPFVEIKVINTGVGVVSEGDIKNALSSPGSFVVAFHTGTDRDAESLADRNNIPIYSFEIIYKLTEWLAQHAKEVAPKFKEEIVHGEARIACVFNNVKGNQICGGKVGKGYLSGGDMFRLIRKGETVCTGKIRELQSQKARVSDVKEGMEFGAMIDCKMAVSESDRIEVIHIEEK